LLVDVSQFVSLSERTLGRWRKTRDGNAVQRAFNKVGLRELMKPAIERSLSCIALGVHDQGMHIDPASTGSNQLDAVGSPVSLDPVPEFRQN
jgi:hypothetical protein